MVKSDGKTKPQYIIGKSGVIVAAHGVIHNPQDHRGLYSLPSSSVSSFAAGKRRPT